METPTSPSPTQADVAALRRRTVLHEFLELLVLRQRAVAVGVGGVVLLGLLLTIVAPGLVPSTLLVGVVVGLLALAVGVALAFVAHRQDPVLRAPGQARWDGLKVLAWVPSLEPSSLTPVVGLVEDRVAATGRHRLLVVDGGAGAREAAAAVGAAAADVGARTLVVDLTDATPQPGMAAVGDGSMTLGAAATVDRDRHHATIGAGHRLADAVAATRALLERPKRDLDLLVVVAPDDEDGRRSLLPVVDRAVLVVNAGSRQRAAVRDRLARLGSPVPVEVLLVGGHLTDVAPGAERTSSRPVVDDPAPRAPDGRPPSVTVVAGSNGDATPPSTPPPDDPVRGTRGASPPAAAPPPPVIRGGPPPAPDAADRGDPDPGGRGGGGTATAIAVAPAATDVLLDERPASPTAQVAQVDGSWQFRPFRADDAPLDRTVDRTVDRVVADPVDAPWAWATTIDLADDCADDGAVDVADDGAVDVADDGAVDVADDEVVDVTGEAVALDTVSEDEPAPGLRSPDATAPEVADDVPATDHVAVLEDDVLVAEQSVEASRAMVAAEVDEVPAMGEDVDDQADDVAMLLEDSEDPDATAEVAWDGSMADDATAPTGEVDHDGEDDDEELPAFLTAPPTPLRLEATDDLVTTATLEFLAASEADDER